MLSNLWAILLQPRDTLSSVRWSFGRHTRSLTIGRKLLIAFLSLAAMAGLCGSIGLIYFERIAGSVSVLSEITSPLLIESMALIDNADHMRSVILDGVSHADASETQLATLTRLDEEGRDHVKRLMALSLRVGLWSRFEPVEQLQSDFVSTLREIISVRSSRARANNAVSKSDALTTRALLGDGQILAIIRRLKDKIAENNALAKDDTQESKSTSDTLRALLFGTNTTLAELEAAYQLLHATARAHELAQAVVSVEGELDLALLEGEAQRHFVSISSARQRLAMLSATELSLEALQLAILGPEGVVAKKREFLTATARLTARLKKLSEIQIRYLDVLTGVAAAVRGGNTASMARTESTIAQGRAIIMAVVALSALLGLAAAFFLKSGITTPLDCLTKHVRAIRARGDLIEISDRWLMESADELGDLARSFNGMIGELAEARRELIARSEAEISKQVERLEAALTNMSQGLCMFDRDQRIIVSNKQYAETYRIAPTFIRAGTTLREILKERVKVGSYYGNPDTYVEQGLETSEVVEPSDGLVELQNGRTIHIQRRPMKDGGWVATHEDVTERRLAEAKIAHMARHDALTNLPNRLLFRESIEQALEGVSRGASIAVLSLDLDHFKTANDTLGHPIGDTLLRAVTERLIKCVRETDVLARLGGDEFAIIQTATDGGLDTSSLAQRAIDAVSLPYELDGHQVVIGASIGIALAPGDGAEPDELLKNADLALYRAKSDGRGIYRFFEAEMDARMQARRTLELDLRKAFVAGEFELYYQPLINVESGEIAGFESLLRWNHPERGLVSPAEFMPVAEEIGLMVPLGEWVLRRACQQATTWPPNVHVAVNLSAVQFKSRNLVTAVTLALSSAGLAANRLELEVTEAALLEESESALATLHQLRNLGARISMDDFGTGSLNYLHTFPFDKIKIDRSFIQDMGDGEHGIAIVRAATGLGSSLGMTTTAEGVETKEQLERLRTEGCTEVQGYLFSRPRPASELATLLAAVRKSGIAA